MLCRGYIGIIEKKRETTIMGLHRFRVLGLRAWGLGMRVYGLRFRGLGFWFRD